MKSSELPVGRYLAELHELYRNNFEGRLATYIPQLGEADAAGFAIAVATADGFVYEVGDCSHAFTVQSVSKPLVYGFALEEHGLAYVQTRVGVGPSGDAFNSISFDERHNRPFNPMVNPGAIATTSLIAGDGPEARISRIAEVFERFTGRHPALDHSVYSSESETGHRNRAIAYLERASQMIDGDVDEHLDVYFRQCSLLVTARDLAIAAATLANDGLNPITRVRALRSENVRAVLSVMNSCGMYDYAGEWQFDVGLPAKSGVSGGIMAVVPGQFGIGVYSPLLDEVGNSIRGVKVCEELSRKFRLHLLEQREAASTALRRRYSGSEVRSKRLRKPSDRLRLKAVAGQIEVLELQGDLLFAEAEKISRHVAGALDRASYFVLDIGRLERVDAIAFDLFASLSGMLAARGKNLFLAGEAAIPIPPELPLTTRTYWFDDTEQALEFLEDLLLGNTRAAISRERDLIPLAETEIMAGMTPEQRAVFAALLESRSFRKGEHLVKMGTPSDGFFILVRGSVDVSVPVGADGERHRVTTIDAGNIFGELALFDGSLRTADILGASGGEAYVLTSEALQRLRDEQPDSYRHLLLAVGRSLAERLGSANQEIRALAR